MEQNSKLKIFVGSSSEAIEDYESICEKIEDLGHEAVGWKTSFQKGEIFLDSLFRIGNEVDAALLVATPDDILSSRGHQQQTLRDNVLFETGLFMGMLGRASTALIVTGHSTVKLPSDLAGLNTFIFCGGKENSFAKDLRQWAVKAEESRSSDASVRKIQERIQKIPKRYFPSTKSLLVPRVNSLFTQASHGVIDLTPEQYFERIRKAVKTASKETTILAVASTLSTVRWANDPMQNNYFEQNYIAGARGVSIKRLFILDKPSLTTSEARSLSDHIANKIPIKCISRDVLTTSVDDVVLFQTPELSTAYKAHVDEKFNDRVVAAQMLIDQDHCADLRRRFSEIWEVAWMPEMEGNAINIPGMRIPPPTKHRYAPGLEMPARWTSTEVITCHSAAEVRGHDIERELKSLVLTSSRGICVVHVPGNRRVSLRKIKSHFGGDAQAYMLDPGELLDMQLGAGVVCAVLEPVWSMLHLIDGKVLEHKKVVTNNGTRNGYFDFDPHVLKSARHIAIGDFVED